MKERVQKNTSPEQIDKSANQHAFKDVLQKYRNKTAQLASQEENPISSGEKVAQLAAYSKKIKANTDIMAADMANWNTVRTKLGVDDGGAPRDIGKKVNKSLSELKINTTKSAMSAHMIPDRIGGAGDSTNVMPWDSAFENGKWKKDVEDKFDSQVANMKKDDEISYTVNTMEMTESEADTIIGKSPVAAEKTKAHHKERILQIPVKVNATVGASTLSDTNETIVNLIKS